jgi:DNA-binding CsgD family transcriptional regulator
LDLALPTGEGQRVVPVAFARAEAAWLAGEPAGIAVELAVVRELPSDELDDWQRGELAWWSRAAGLGDEPTGTVAAPFAAMLDERWIDAAAAWDEVGCPPWASVARSRAPGLEPAREALTILDHQGAVAVRAAVLRDRHGLGMPVPRQPRRRAEDSPAGLTAREQEVLALLAEGLTNAELARRLFLSEKTVDHHVSAVLRKLGEPSRARAVAVSHERGLLPKSGRTPDVPNPSSAV